MYAKRRLSKVGVFFLVWVYCICPYVEAISLNRLYQAVVTIESKELAQRSEAFQRALDDVIVKAAATESVLQEETYQSAREQAEHFISKYTYLDADDQLLLEVGFNEELVNELVSKLKGHLPLGRNRPLTMIWLLHETPEQIRILGGDNGLDIVENLEFLAQKRGLPTFV